MAPSNYVKSSTLLPGLMSRWGFAGNANDSIGPNNGTAAGSLTYSNANQVTTLDFVDSTGSGTFTISIAGTATAPITYSATAATLQATETATGFRAVRYLLEVGLRAAGSLFRRGRRELPASST